MPFGVRNMELEEWYASELKDVRNKIAAAKESIRIQKGRAEQARQIYERGSDEFKTRMGLL